MNKSANTKHNHELWGKLFQRANIGIALISLEGTVLEVNQEFNRMCGMPVDAPNGWSFLELIQAPEQSMFIERATAVVHGRKSYAKMDFILQPIGSKEMSCHASLSAAECSPDASQLIITLNDMTAYRQSAEALWLSETRLEALKTLIRMSASSWIEITDFALEEAVRLTRSRIGYFAFLNDDQTILTMQAWSRVSMAECQMKEKPLRYPVADTGLWGEAVRQRRPIITNDYNASNPLKKGYPEGHVPVLRHMNVPVFEGDKIVLVAGVGNKLDEYNESDARQLTLFMNAMWQVLQRKRFEDELIEHREHLELLVRTRTAALQRSNEKLEQEITAREVAQAEVEVLNQGLRKQTVELQKAYKELESFSYSVAHDLRAPLRILSSYANILSTQHSQELSSDGQFLIGRLAEQSTRLNSLIEDLLRYSQSWNHQIKKRRIDLTALARWALTYLLPEYPDTLFDISIQQLPESEADPGLMEMVYINLLSNALKFSSRSVKPQIEVGVTTIDNEVAFYVRDNGIGFSMNDADRLFKVFQQLHDEEKFGGTGLGLASVHRIITRHGGRVWAESEPGKGSTFFFTLHQASPLPAPPQSETEHIKGY